MNLGFGIYWKSRVSASTRKPHKEKMWGGVVAIAMSPYQKLTVRSKKSINHRINNTFDAQSTLSSSPRVCKATTMGALVKLLLIKLSLILEIWHHIIFHLCGICDGTNVWITISIVISVKLVGRISFNILSVSFCNFSSTHFFTKPSCRYYISVVIKLESSLLCMFCTLANSASMLRYLMI